MRDRPTLDIEVVTVANGRLQEDSNGVGQLLVAFVSKGGQAEVLVGAIIDGEVADLRLCERVVVVSFDHLWLVLFVNGDKKICRQMMSSVVLILF